MKKHKVYYWFELGLWVDIRVLVFLVVFFPHRPVCARVVSAACGLPAAGREHLPNKWSECSRCVAGAAGNGGK